MRVISRKALLEFARRHADAGPALDTWFRVAKRTCWRSLAGVRKDFPSADLVSGQTVFNIRGNRYRLVCWINYWTQRVFILNIMTHAEYSKGDWER